ncbi:MAG: hypothetical protein LBI15_06650 [Dysgonamonadaceae bacterium]|jgi:hypothetical protein|nr:hypothetical protein [Dysgonamonadaceae bacterium]
MKTIKKIILGFLLCVSYNTISIAQNLSSMPIAQRDSLLISIAKEVVLKYGPDYYREYQEPEIIRKQIPLEGDVTGGNAGRYGYVITFLYDPSKETLEWDYAARVGIWEDTGRPSGVSFGNGLGLTIPEVSLRSSDEVIETIPYQQSIRAIYDFNNSDPNQMPQNIDELRRTGRERNSDGQWVQTRPDTPPAEAQRVIRRAQEDMRRRQTDRNRENNR